MPVSRRGRAALKGGVVAKVFDVWSEDPEL